MVDAQVIARRLLALNEALADLQRPDASNVAALTQNRMLRAAVERWLQIAIEACADIADHVISDAGWTPPDASREAFTTLAAHGMIPVDLADRLGRAVGLRNVLVHDYVAVDLARLGAVVAHDLGDLRAFAGYAAGWLSDGG